MRPGHYTELFFLDEATALAAGHRPCAECQRARFNLFRALWASANPHLTSMTRPTATVLDAVLHQERLAQSAQAQRFCHTVALLPDGTFVTDEAHSAYLVWGGRLWRWSPTGYAPSTLRALKSPARILTPDSVVRTLAAGYPVGIHTSVVPMLAGE
jgi:hypothetical protein